MVDSTYYKSIPYQLRNRIRIRVPVRVLKKKKILPNWVRRGLYGDIAPRIAKNRRATACRGRAVRINQKTKMKNKYKTKSVGRRNIARVRSTYAKASAYMCT